MTYLLFKDAVLGWDGLMDTGIDCNNRGMFIIFYAQKAFKMLQND